MRYIDAHNHLHDEWLDPQRVRIMSQLEALPIAASVVNGTHEDDWEKVGGLARKHSWVIPSYGLHPWHAGNAFAREEWLGRLRNRLADDTRAGVGEIGLDRWMLDRAKPDDARLAGLRRAPMSEQLDVFKKQLRLAAEFDRVATIHCIDAWGPLMEVLQSEAVPRRGVLLHAFGGSSETLRHLLRLGAMVSFNGYFLNERKAREREIFRTAPLDRILIETDAPAMPLPQPWRTYKLPAASNGETVNHPANIEAAYAGLAALRGISVGELADAVSKNFERLFHQ